MVKMGKIVYLGHFADGKNKRVVFTPAQTVIRYMRRGLNEAGYSFTMVSLAQASRNIPRVEEIYDDKTKLIFARCFKVYEKNILMRAVNKFRRGRSFQKELESIIEDGDTLISYHSLSTMNLITKLRKKKKFKFILQVCEIYADVTENQKLKAKEIEFIKSADKYILISDMLKKEIGLENKECIVCSGAYEVKEVINEPPKDGKIHVVYAGTMDEKKGGAYYAASAAEYLNENYHIHILGTTIESQREKLQSIIDEVKTKSKCEVSYEGYMGGEKYTKFLQSCHIGLSTQSPEGAYNATSFPSKIPVYMSNGLQVVSVRIPVVENSPIGKSIHFYDNQDAKSIADAILSVKVDEENNGREIVKKLNSEFVQGLKKLIENKKEV